MLVLYTHVFFCRGSFFWLGIEIINRGKNASLVTMNKGTHQTFLGGKPISPIPPFCIHHRNRVWPIYSSQAPWLEIDGFHCAHPRAITGHCAHPRAITGHCAHPRAITGHCAHPRAITGPSHCHAE